MGYTMSKLDYSFTQATTSTSIYNETQKSRPYRFYAPNSWINDITEYEKKTWFNVYELTKDITTSVYEMGNKLEKDRLSTEKPPTHPITGKKAPLLKYNYKKNVGFNNNILDMN